MAEHPDRERVRRIGLNQAVYRTVNDRVEGIAATLKTGPAQLLLVCECGDISCDEQIELSRADYEPVRSDSSPFAVVPGHAADSIESVIRRGPRFELVRKKPAEQGAFGAD